MPRCTDGGWCIDDLCYGGRTLCGVDSSEYNHNGEFRAYDLDVDPYDFTDDDWAEQ